MEAQAAGARQAADSGGAGVGGVGMLLRGDLHVSIIERSGSAHGQVAVGDRLMSVDGTKVAGLSNLEAAVLLRGPLGSSAQVVLAAPGILASAPRCRKGRACARAHACDCRADHCPMPCRRSRRRTALSQHTRSSGARRPSRGATPPHHTRTPSQRRGPAPTPPRLHGVRGPAPLATAAVSRAASGHPRLRIAPPPTHPAPHTARARRLLNLPRRGRRRAARPQAGGASAPGCASGSTCPSTPRRWAARSAQATHSYPSTACVSRVARRTRCARAAARRRAAAPCWDAQHLRTTY